MKKEKIIEEVLKLIDELEKGKLNMSIGNHTGFHTYDWNQFKQKIKEIKC